MPSTGRVKMVCWRSECLSLRSSKKKKGRGEKKPLLVEKGPIVLADEIKVSPTRFIGRGARRNQLLLNDRKGWRCEPATLFGRGGRNAYNGAEGPQGTILLTKQPLKKGRVSRRDLLVLQEGRGGLQGQKRSTERRKVYGSL